MTQELIKNADSQAPASTCRPDWIKTPGSLVRGKFQSPGSASTSLVLCVDTAVKLSRVYTGPTQSTGLFHLSFNRPMPCTENKHPSFSYQTMHSLKSFLSSFERRALCDIFKLTLFCLKIATCKVECVVQRTCLSAFAPLPPCTTVEPAGILVLQKTEPTAPQAVHVWETVCLGEGQTFCTRRWGGVTPER